MTDKKPAPLTGPTFHDRTSKEDSEKCFCCGAEVDEVGHMDSAQCVPFFRETIRSLRARLKESLGLLDDALKRQLHLCGHTGIGLPGCLICDIVRLDRVRK